VVGDILRRVSVLRKLFVCVIFFVLVGCVSKSEILTVPVNGVDIGYRIQGEGEPLLMIMGYAGTMDVWDNALIDALAKKYQVILFDNRNVGYSSSTSETVTIPLMAQDSLGLLDALGIESAHVFGWSMGSIIAQEMALAHPEKVRKLILYGTAFEREPVMEALNRFDGLTPQQFAALLFPKPWTTQHPDIYSHLPVPKISAIPEAINRQRQALAGWEGTGNRLSGLNKDVLLVVGEEDSITPLEQSLKIVGMIDGAWLARFKGAGHWLMYQTPTGLASVVLEFMKVRQDLLD
jgi:pimeloyl-ACP methyl ester carboxylesterase